MDPATICYPQGRRFSRLAIIGVIICVIAGLTLFLILICLSRASSFPAAPVDLPLEVEVSGVVKVDALVARLVSRRPAPYPTGHFTNREVDYITPEVDAAIQELKKEGTRIFPALVTHLDDDRYSFSRMINGWVNEKVRDAVMDVLSEGTEIPYEYLSRETPSGHSRCPLFEDYLRVSKPKQWAGWAKDKTRAAIQVDYLQWALKKEEEQGFVSQTQREKILAKYEKALKEAAKSQGVGR
jgi:hypothetical protein